MRLLATFIAYFFALIGLAYSLETGLVNNVAQRRWPAAIEKLARRDNSSSSSTIVQLGLSKDRSSYYAIFQIGNFSFRLSVDTASSDLWLISSACSSSSCKGLPSYPLSYHSASFGAINNNQTLFNLSFTDGSVSNGYLAKEAVSLNLITVSDQVIGLANATNTTLGSDISGVVGMGFPRLSEFSSLFNGSTPFVSGLAQRGLIDYPLFGLSLTWDNGGTLALGALDAGVVGNVSNIEWHEVVPFSPFRAESNSSSYLQWVIQMPTIGVNFTMLETRPSYPEFVQSSLALIDVGTNGIYGPYQDVSRIFDNFRGARLVNANAGQWALPCDTEEVLIFNFGGKNFTLQPTDYLIGPVTSDPTICYSWPRAVQNSGDGIDWQLGTPFLRTVYSVFSYGIDNKEPPMIGLLAVNNVSTIRQNATQISSFFSSHSMAIPTTLPNTLLSTPSATASPYLFNTSVPTGLAGLPPHAPGTSTYNALLSGQSSNASALPFITAPPSAVTYLITDASGVVHTLTSQLPSGTVVLGLRPGQISSASSVAECLLKTIVVLGIMSVLTVL